MPDGTNLVAGTTLDAKQLVARANAAFAGRRNFETTWEDSRRLFLPDAAPFNFSNTTPGQRDKEATIDTYGRFCARQHATFLFGAIVNGDNDWFKVVAEGPRGEEATPEILRIADDTRDTLAAILMSDTTGFSEQVFAMLAERTVFGQGTLYGGDRPGGLPIVRATPIRDTAYEGGAGHEPGGYWWRQTLTAAEWRAKFPRRVLGEKVDAAASSDTRQNELFTFTHGSILNPDWRPASIDQAPPQHRRVLTVWLNPDENHLVASNFLTSDPYTAFRCPRRAGELYGRAPAEEAIEEAAMAQRFRAVIIRGIEKVVDPQMILPDDGVLTPPTNEAEGAMIVRADLMRGAGDPIRYLRNESRPDIGQEFLKDSVYGAMDRAFARDVMTLPREPRMIESQIIGLQEEQSRGVVPLVSPLFGPMARFIARIYDIAYRARRLPVLPPEMAGWTLSIEFRNPLEKAARLAEVRAFMQALSILVQAVQIDPGARHALKVVEGVQYCARILGVPERLIATKKEIDAALAAVAELQKQNAGMEQGLDLSTIMKNIGGAARGLAPANANAEQAA